MNLLDALGKFKEVLTAPGNGVYTVHTAKERKEKIQNDLYPNSKDIEKSFFDTLQNQKNFDLPLVFGMCSDAGGGILRGANWGPLFLRQYLMDIPLNNEYFDMGDLRVIPHLLHDKYLNEKTIGLCQKSLYGDDKDLPVSPLSMAESLLENLYKNQPGVRVFGIGGDHGNSFPLTKTWLQYKKSQGIKTAIIHFDAHTDLMESRLGIDYCFATWCTHILNDLPDPSLLIQLGIRSSGQPKSYWENKYGVTQYWAKELIEKGPSKIVAKINEQLVSEKVDEVYISFDIDALDAEYAPATGTPEKGGPSPDIIMGILRGLTKNIQITGADMMEIAPFLNTGLSINPPMETTLSVAAGISNYIIGEMAKKD